MKQILRPDQMMHEPIQFEHDVIYYVPVFQVNPGDKDDLFPGYPNFTHHMGDATLDSQMAYSMEPDYVLELTGVFKATTKPFIHPDIYSGHGNGD